MIKKEIFNLTENFAFILKLITRVSYYIKKERENGFLI
jgi:hypothetical protein